MQSMDHRHGHVATHRGGVDGGEPARSRWAPKPEQILILESIFNSGMVNPAKDDTTRIRRLLERFGAVRDANVFYWFQNRRSRSRRRARQQLQQSFACAAASIDHQLPHGARPGAGYHDDFAGQYRPSPFVTSAHDQHVSAVTAPMAPSVGSVTAAAASAHFLADVDVDDGGGDDLFAISRQMGRMARGGADDSSQLMSCYHQQTGKIQVFINGVAYEVPSGGALDMAGTFGRDAVLVHSSGEILPVDEHGVLIKSLHMGECYYLVSRSI